MKILVMALGLFLVSATSARAETAKMDLMTVGMTIARLCPSAEAATLKADGAHAMASDTEYALRYQAAALYYQCAKTVSDPYLRTWIRAIYACALAESARTTDEVLARYPVSSQILKDLAENSKYDDVRAGAMKMYKVFILHA